MSLRPQHLVFRLFVVTWVLLAASLGVCRGANILQTYYTPFPENDMQESLNVIDAFQGNIGNQVRTVVSMVAGTDGTVIYYDHWEDGYEDVVTSPTQVTTEVWGDSNPTNGIPAGYASDVVNAGSIVNLEETIDVTRSAILVEYDGKDKISATLPISLARAIYPLTPGEVIAEAGTALELSMWGTNYIAAVGWGCGSAPYTNEVFEYTAFYIMAGYDYTFVEVDKDNDGTFETSAHLNEGEVMFVNGGVVVGAKARGNRPFQCHLVTGDIYSTYETRWFTQWPVENWSADYYSPVGSRDDTSVGVYYGALVFLFNPHTNAINVECITATSTTIVSVAAYSVSTPFTMPQDGGAYFYTTNSQTFFASEVFDNAIGLVNQLQDYDWGFSLLPGDALTTMGIVGWGPGEGVSDVGTNGSPAWVVPLSNTTLYVDYDGNPGTGPLTDSYGSQYDYSTNLARFQVHLIFDNSDTNQTGVRYYTLDGTPVAGAWGVDPVAATPYLPYLDAGYELMPFPSVMARKYSILIVDMNTNGYPDPGDELEFEIDVVNVGFATANNVMFQDEPPTNLTYYSTNSAYVNGAEIFDDLPPKLTRFPFDEGGYNIGTVNIGATSRVSYVTIVSTTLPSDFSGYVHNNATVGNSNGNWTTVGFTNIVVGGLGITKTASTTNTLDPGDVFTYSVSVVNTGMFTYSGLRLEDTLPEGVTYIDGTATIQYPIGLTNTVRDTFAMRAFTNSMGLISWLNNWQEEGEADGALGGDIRVAGDTGVSPLESYALFVSAPANAAWRSADLSGHNSAILSFRYRREGLDDVTEYVDVFVSTNGWAQSNFLGRFQGAATDTSYTTTNIEISTYISTNTAIKFVSPAGNEAAEGVWFDDIKITLTGSNVTFSGEAPPLLFNGLSLPPSTNITVTFDVFVNVPPTATQLVNTARVRADQHANWLYAYHVTNSVDARSSLEIFKTNNPSGQVGPGSNITYTIRLVNTGDVSQTSVDLNDVLPLGVTYVPGSARIWRPYLHTNTFRDLFNFQAYTNSDGDIDWSGNWTETGDDNDPEAGNAQVANDSGTIPGHVYALRIAATPTLTRYLDLGGGYTNALLTFEHRRQGLDAATDYVRIDASANGGGAWTEVGRVTGAVGTDSGYQVSNINITAYIATNTGIRFVGVGMAADDYIWFDDIRVAASSRNATNNLRGVPDMFSGYQIPPYTSMVVSLQATVDSPAAATQLVNIASVTSAQQTNELYASATNWQLGVVGLSLSKTSSVSGHNWGIGETNTYTIAIANTGTIAQTGIRVTDYLPSGTVYVADSTIVITPALVTNVTTNVTLSTETNTVRDEFNARAYTNNDGTINWSANWTEVSDDGNVAAGDVLVANVLDTWELVTKDNGNGAYRNFNLSGYTNAVLSFDWARFLLDAGDYYAVYISSNNGTAYTQLIQYNGNSGTDAAYSSTNFNITAFISANMRIRFFTTDGSIDDNEGMRWDNVQILATRPIYTTNFTTNVAWTGSATNAGGPPSILADGCFLPTGTTMTVTFKVTLPLPTDYTAVTNTVFTWSEQITNLQASVTDRIARVVIGDFVWFDADTNGLQNVGEPGVTNVTVRLYDGRTNLLATTTTDSSGLYQFAGWPATNFFVEFVAPTGYWFTLQDTVGSDTNDSDANPTTGRTIIFTHTGTTNDLKWDAGLYRPPATLGDQVWLDSNTNGLQNVGESGVTGVVVRLYNSSSNIVATTTNNASGLYSFTGLDSGYYFLEFLISSNYTFTLQDQGSSDTNDSDVSTSTGRTPLFFLPPGTNDLSWDAGLTPVTRGLRIIKTSNSGGSCWDPGDTVTYTIVVANTGTVAQSGVTLQDTFPAGATFISNSIAIRGPVSGLTGAPPTLAYGYTLASGQAITVTVQVAVNTPGTTNSLLNVASAYSAIQPAIYASVTDCVASADLGVTKTASDPIYAEVQSMEWRITITNKGPDTATGVQIADTLPAQVQYNSHTNGTYSTSDNLWNIGTLPVGSSTTLYINCTVRENTKGMTITNMASVYSRDLFDPVSTNDSDDERIMVTIVVLSRFDAVTIAGAPGVEWETASEFATIGFHVYRLDDASGAFMRINDRLLPGVITAPQGGVYQLVDPTARPGATCTYRLDEVEREGKVNSYGPFTVTMPVPRSAKSLATEPAAPSYVRAPRTSAFSNRRRDAVADAEPAPTFVPQPLSRPTLKRGPGLSWTPIKMTVQDEGVYFVSAASVAAAIGQSEESVATAITDLSPSIQNRGQESTYLPASNGLYFFAESIDEPWATNNVYWILWTGGEAMSQLGGSFPVPVEGGSFTGSVHIEENHYAAPALTDDPFSDYWYWSFFFAGDPDAGSNTYQLVPTALSSDPGTATLTVQLLGGSDTDAGHEHHVTFSVNGSPVGEHIWDGIASTVATCSFDSALLFEGTNLIGVTAVLGDGIPYSVVYLDSFDLSYPRTYEAERDQLILRGNGNPAVTVFGLSTSTVRVLDVSDPANPVVLTGVSIDELAGAWRATFSPQDASTPYCVCTEDAQAPITLAARTPANLRTPADALRYILITTPDLAAACEELADYRRDGRGWNARVVLLEDIYDEFAYGLPDPSAIRDFLTWISQNWGPSDPTPFRILLGGEGTYDYLDYGGFGDNRVPAMMVTSPYGLTISDGWYADVDTNGLPDMAIGRLPALTHAEMANYAARIMAYESGEGGSWRQTVLLVADNPDDGGDFHSSSDAVGAYVPRDYVIDRAYLEAGSIDTTRPAVLGAIGSGALFVNYFGHGGYDRLAGEGLITTTDTLTMTNSARLPVVLSLACSIGQFGRAGYDCLAEALMLSTGGAIAVWAPSSLAYNHESTALGDALYNAVFRDHVPLLGDAILAAARAYGSAGTMLDVPRMYNLLGDPALQLGGSASLGPDGNLGEWKDELFTDAELGDFGVSGDEADPDSDGLDNIWEYALGWNPRVSDGSNQVIALRRDLSGNPPANSDAVFRYTRRKDAADLDFTVESSDDVGTWQYEADVITGTSVEDDGNGVTETVSVYVSIPADRTSRNLFLRLRVDQN